MIYVVNVDVEIEASNPIAAEDLVMEVFEVDPIFRGFTIKGVEEL